MKKRLLSTLLALCVVLALIPGTALASSLFYILPGGGELKYTIDTTAGVRISGCSGVTELVIPSEINGVPVTTIGQNAFYINNHLVSVTIPNSVTSIEGNAFYECSNLTSVTIPNSVTSIGASAFRGCSSLTSATIPNSVTNIEAGAFYGCSSLTSVSIPNSVTTIGEGAFSNCSILTSVDIPASVTTIGDGAFSGSGLTSVIIPASVTTIGKETFFNCSSLASVSVPASVTSIGESAFGPCSSLTDVYYGGSESQLRKTISIDFDIDDDIYDEIIISMAFYRNYDLGIPTIHYNSAEPDQGISTPTPSGGEVEHIYDTIDPGEDTKMDAERLNSVTDPSTAAEAVRDMTSGMTQAQKNSPTGADLATLYAETAVAKAASKPFTENDILINAAAVADLEMEAAQAVAAVDTALVNGGVATARYISNTVTLTTSSTSEISIRIDPDILTTGVDKIRVEGPGYALTFNVSELEEDLTEILTFKAEPVNATDTMLANGNLARPLAISLRGFSPVSSGLVYVADKTETKAVKVTLPGGSTTNPVTVSLPKDTSKDTTYQAVVNTAGTTTSSKYNPATTNIDGKVNTSGTYMVETKEVNFTDITNKSAEMQKAIKYLAARGVISGTGGTNYSPDASISRAEIAALIVRALGKLDSSATNSFADVKTSDWYYTAAGSSQRAGYISGFEDNTFRGTSAINKEQIVAVAARVLINDMKYKTPSNTASYLGKYKDTVASWAQSQVALATKENLVVYRTDGTFSGAKDMTRGDAAIIIYRLFQKIW